MAAVSVGGRSVCVTASAAFLVSTQVRAIQPSLPLHSTPLWSGPLFPCLYSLSSVCFRVTSTAFLLFPYFLFFLSLPLSFFAHCLPSFSFLACLFLHLFLHFLRPLLFLLFLYFLFLHFPYFVPLFFSCFFFFSSLPTLLPCLSFLMCPSFFSYMSPRCLFSLPFFLFLSLRLVCLCTLIACFFPSPFILSSSPLFRCFSSLIVYFFLFRSRLFPLSSFFHPFHNLFPLFIVAYARSLSLPRFSLPSLSSLHLQVSASPLLFPSFSSTFLSSSTFLCLALYTLILCVLLSFLLLSFFL